MAHAQHLDHPFGPVYDANSSVLVLGSFPSPKSREMGFFYGHPQNRFWPLLARLFDEPVPSSVERRRDFALRHHIALWDSLASCSIEGASDASITDVVPNDFAEILRTARIERVFCNGATSAKYYRRYCQPETGIPCIQMPSTSPANAAWNMDRLAQRWGELAQALDPYRPPALSVAQVVALEQAIAASGTSLAELMDRAGMHLAYRVHQLAPTSRVAILCGNGNNGGDGWVAARELRALGHDVALISAKAPDALKAEPAAPTAQTLASTLAQAGVGLLTSPADDEVRQALENADVVIDALLGTGFAHDAVREPFAQWIRLANARRDAGALIVAADVPSGVNADSGTAAEPSIEADATVTMIAPKHGLFAGEGAKRAGTVHVAPLAYVEPLM